MTSGHDKILEGNKHEYPRQLTILRHKAAIKAKQKDILKCIAELIHCNTFILFLLHFIIVC